MSKKNRIAELAGSPSNPTKGYGWEYEDGIRFRFDPGLPSELRSSTPVSSTPWSSSFTADVLDPTYDNTKPYDQNDFEAGKRRFEESTIANVGAMLIKPELMPNGWKDFRSLSWAGEEGMRTAVDILFESRRNGALKLQYQKKGIWGADSESDGESWILMFERFHIKNHARRQGWGRKCYLTIMEEVLEHARAAGKAVLVLVMPAAPEKEFTSNTGLTSFQGQFEFQRQTLRVARAFWRSLGFIRMGETLFFGWTRDIGDDLDRRQAVNEEDLDKDYFIDQQEGHLLCLKI
ncbi:hypothetical protein H072_2 [Dactylellina haptotyla CBS 200.50]|uniref:N-acetyltransferase domain-containing protein n=1 Tax=Dactylellina haptotyla (strain CBS 200.50) TaxID=1284197 RepID=S8ASZ3_DACHA|nr:hypothetical protein H072_2 [Dactylellina haptotyla CBS 200.50]